MDEAIQKLQTPKEICLLILFVSCIISIIVTGPVIFKRKSNNIKIIPIYILLVLLQLSIAYYEMFWSVNISHGKTSIMNTSAYFFIAIEFLIFCRLIWIAISNLTIKNIIVGLSILFPILSIIVWTETNSLFNALSVASTLESLLLIPICLYYFFELLKKPPVLNLTQEPFFWIITGILFLVICLSPFYLAIGYFKPTPEMQIVDHIAYLILVALFTKSVIVDKSN
jgi:hypothetical protein